MTTEHSTYTYEGGEQETVTLRRGNADPHGHALLKIDYSDGQAADCYVNTAWLRDRLNDLGEPSPLTPDAITNETRERAYRAVAALSACDWDDMSGVAKGGAMALVEAVITEITRPEPPARPEGAEEIDEPLRQANAAALGGALTPEQRRALADHLAAMHLRVVGEEDPR